MDYVLSVLFVPLEACNYGLELLYKVPFATALIVALAILPMSWIGDCSHLVYQYPLFATVFTLMFLVVAVLSWLFFGTLLAALAQTMWWSLWYAPLWLGVGRLLWILCRRYILGRLGWRRRIEAAIASTRSAFQTRLTAIAMQISFNQLFRSWAPTGDAIAGEI